uniref:Variant surface glycoprotein 1125.3 n=1 Tax=Trypanosoma brucei TaxID=5691 RepID=A0A1J0R409_9TRYP|nr:variant surface glycoprotein 1125.3 [Trypanosoma brucei]
MCSTFKGRKSILLPLLLIVQVSLHKQSAGQNIAGAANKAEYAVLCKMIAIAEAGIEVPSLEDTTGSDYDFIQEVNMTISTDNWRKMFFKGPGKGDWHTTPESAKQTNKGYEEKWPTWQETAKRLAADAKPPELQKTQVDKLTQSQITAIAQHIHAEADLAERAKSAIVRATRDASAITEDEAAAPLKKAVYGTGPQGRTDVTATQAFGGDIRTGNRADICSTGASGKAKTSVVATAACICLRHNGGSDVQGACTPKTEGGTTWQDSTAAPADGDLQNLAKYCPHRTNKATAEDLARALGEFTDLITTDSTDGFYGSYKATGCNGKQDGGVCLKIDGYGTGGSSKLKDLTWFSELQALETKITERKNAAQNSKAMTERIRAAADQMKRLIERGHSAPRSLTALSAGEKTVPKQLSQELAEDKQKLCDKHHASQTDCDSKDFCTYDKTESTDKKCKFNSTKASASGVPVTQSQTGGTETATEKCKDKKKDECKDGCKWDGKECKDSSILVNKKFALSVVSAAFVALLF